MTGGCKCRLGDREFWLVYTADAYFDIQSAYGSDLIEKLRPGTRDAYEVALGCLLILAREGELCRRYMGYDHEPMMTEEDIRRCILPDSIVRLKTLVNDAILAGLHIENSEGPDNEPVDIGLLEYEKKTELS